MDTREYYRKYRKEHPDTGKEARKRWAKEHKELINARKRASRKNNPPSKKERKDAVERTKRWREKHPDSRCVVPGVRKKKKCPHGDKGKNKQCQICKRITENTRRARIRGSGGTYTYEEFKALGSRCLCCGRSEEELLLIGLLLVPDHIIALAKGGSNDISNIQPLCHGKGGCNNHKGTKHMDYRKRATE